MIKCFFILSGVTIITGMMDVEKANAQAPTPVICVSGCAAGTGTVTALQGGGSWTVTATGSFTVTNTNANGQATMANSSPVALASNQSVADPCMFQAKTNLPVSVVTAISVQLVGLSTGTKVYVCSLSLVGSTATAFSMTTGTGTACATSAVAVMGATTATTGMSLATNGGLTLGNGSGTIAVGGTSAELCIIQSGGGTLAGNLTYVQQ